MPSFQRYILILLSSSELRLPLQGPLEDPGGEPLLGLLGLPWEITSFLRLAIGVATALGQVHQRGVIHKDIKPANVLVNFATGRVWLMGFGIASRLPRERQAPAPPEVIAGTLGLSHCAARGGR
jgi:serine/threonine protein kinase